MKTKIILFFTLLLIGFSVNSQTKVGSVNSELIISKMPELKIVHETIRTYGAKLDSINATKIKKYESRVKAYAAEVKTLSEAAKKIRSNEINLLNQDLASFRDNATKMMRLRRDELMRPLYQKISEIIRLIAIEKKYTQILTTTGNEFAYLDVKFDITKLVLAKLNIKE